MNYMTGGEITNPSEIAKNYLKGRFIIDFLSAIPIDTMAKWFYNDLTPENSMHLSALSCLKMIRILRINRILVYINKSSEFKLRMKLFKMCIFLLLYVHFTACVWYLFVILEKYETHFMTKDQIEKQGCDLHFKPDSW